jgi:hypothetical protein
MPYVRHSNNYHLKQSIFNATKYNFIRPYQALKGQTSAEVAGLNSNLGENRVEDFMRQAPLKKTPEMFVTALGIRANKIEIIHDNGSVKIKPKEWYYN